VGYLPGPLAPFLPSFPPSSRPLFLGPRLLACLRPPSRLASLMFPFSSLPLWSLPRRPSSPSRAPARPVCRLPRLPPRAPPPGPAFIRSFSRRSSSSGPSSSRSRRVSPSFSALPRSLRASARLPFFCESSFPPCTTCRLFGRPPPSRPRCCSFSVSPPPSALHVSPVRGRPSFSPSSAPALLFLHCSLASRVVSVPSGPTPCSLAFPVLPLSAPSLGLPRRPPRSSPVRFSSFLCPPCSRGWSPLSFPLRPFVPSRFPLPSLLLTRFSFPARPFRLLPPSRRPRSWLRAPPCLPSLGLAPPSLSVSSFLVPVFPFFSLASGLSVPRCVVLCRPFPLLPLSSGPLCVFSPARVPLLPRSFVSFVLCVAAFPPSPVPPLSVFLVLVPVFGGPSLFAFSPAPWTVSVVLGCPVTGGSLWPLLLLCLVSPSSSLPFSSPVPGRGCFLVRLFPVFSSVLCPLLPRLPFSPFWRRSPLFPSVARFRGGLFSRSFVCSSLSSSLLFRPLPRHFRLLSPVLPVGRFCPLRSAARPSAPWFPLSPPGAPAPPPSSAPPVPRRPLLSPSLVSSSYCPVRSSPCLSLFPFWCSLSPFLSVRSTWALWSRPAPSLFSPPSRAVVGPVGLGRSRSVASCAPSLHFLALPLVCHPSCPLQASARASCSRLLGSPSGLPSIRFLTRPPSIPSSFARPSLSSFRPLPRPPSRLL